MVTASEVYLYYKLVQIGLDGYTIERLNSDSLPVFLAIFELQQKQKAKEAEEIQSAQGMNRGI